MKNFSNKFLFATVYFLLFFVMTVFVQGYEEDRVLAETFNASDLYIFESRNADEREKPQIIYKTAGGAQELLQQKSDGPKDSIFPSGSSSFLLRRWNYDAEDNFVPLSVSIGDHGIQVFSSVKTEIHDISNDASLFSSGDRGSALPVWSNMSNQLYRFGERVDSSSKSNFHAQLAFESEYLNDLREPVLRFYSSSDSDPIWEYRFPFEVSNYEGDSLVSRDGNVVVGWAWYGPEFHTKIAIFKSGTNQPDHYISLHSGGEPRGVVLSEDGSHLYLSTGIWTFVIDTSSGEVIHQQTNYVHAAYGHAISVDGLRFAQSTVGHGLRVYEWQGSSYEEIYNYIEPVGNSWAVDISEDGSIVAAAFDHSNFLDVTVRVFDLTLSEPLVFSDTIYGMGNYDNVAEKVDLSDDGKTLALGLWGDEDGLAPEILVYRKIGGVWNRIGTYDLTGSVKDLEISSDGSYLVVGSKSVHNNILASGGNIDFFEIGGARDLLIDGKPSIGQTVRIRHQIRHGTTSRLLASGGLQDSPSAIPGIGYLYLDPNDLRIVGTGQSNNQGWAEIQYVIPNDLSLIGSALYFQGLQSSPLRLSQYWLKMTILP